MLSRLQNRVTLILNTLGEFIHPHHKHVATQTVIYPPTETDLEAVLTVIRENLSASSS
jgi:hypothetical protein